MRKKAALHNLGCKVNAYETEAMRQAMYRRWRPHLNWPLKPEEKLILPEWAEYLPEVEVHLIH